MAIPTHKSAVTAGRRLDYIDALRGFACLWVVAAHAFAQLGAVYVPGNNPSFARHFVYLFVSQGFLGVNIFLVISGFCLFYPVARRNTLDQVGVNFNDFVYKRCRRILPPYYAVLLLIAVMQLLHMWPPEYLLRSPHDFSAAPVKHIAVDTLMHALMVHNLYAGTFFSLNPAFWSLALEFQLYLIFPVLLFLIRKRGLIAMLSVTLVVSLLWEMTIAWLRLHGFQAHLSNTNTWVAVYALPGRCFEFALGMCAAFLVLADRPLWRRAALVVFLVLVPIGASLSLAAQLGPFTSQVWGVAVAAMLVALSGRMPGANPVSPLIRPLYLALILIGEASFSLYLLHEPLISLGIPLVQNHSIFRISSVSYVPALCAWILASICIWVVFHVYIERPFMRKPVPKVEAPKPPDQAVTEPAA